MLSIVDLYTHMDKPGLVMFATTIYVTVVVLATVTILLFVAVLIKGNSVFKEFPFFTIVWNLTIVNLISILLQLTCIIPSLFHQFEKDDHGLWTAWYLVGSSIITVSEAATSYLVCLMAINRFIVFVYPKFERAFSKKNIKYSILVTWIPVSLISALRLFKVNWNVNVNGKYFEFTDTLLATNDPIYIIVVITSYIIPATVFLLYLFIYLYLKKARSRINTSDAAMLKKQKNDKNLLIQGFFLSLSITIWRTLVTVIPRQYSDSSSYYLLLLLKSLANVLNNFLTPFLFLTTNSTVRKIFKNMFSSTGKRTG